MGCAVSEVSNVAKERLFLPMRRVIFRLSIVYAFSTLATQTTRSPAAIAASMIFISRLLLCISGAKILYFFECFMFNVYFFVTLWPK